MEDALRAIAEQSLQAILRLLGDQELTSGQVASHFDVSRPAISQHLQVLKSAGLVTERRLGTRHLYQVRPEALAELRLFLEQFWDGSLTRLAEAAEAEQQRQNTRR